MLKIDLEFIRGMLFVRLEGKLDQNTYTKLSDCLNQMIYEKKIKYFVINLEYLEKMDEIGMKAIMDRYLDVILQNGKLILCGYRDLWIPKMQWKKKFFQIEKTNNELDALKLMNI